MRPPLMSKDYIFCSNIVNEIRARSEPDGPGCISEQAARGWNPMMDNVRAVDFNFEGPRKAVHSEAQSEN
jgi:hypothetical protein